MTSRYVCLSLVLLALCLHGSFAAPQNRLDGGNSESRIARYEVNLKQQLGSQPIQKIDPGGGVRHVGVGDGVQGNGKNIKSTNQETSDQFVNNTVQLLDYLSSLIINSNSTSSNSGSNASIEKDSSSPMHSLMRKINPTRQTTVTPSFYQPTSTIISMSPPTSFNGGKKHVISYSTNSGNNEESTNTKSFPFSSTSSTITHLDSLLRNLERLENINRDMSLDLGSINDPSPETLRYKSSTGQDFTPATKDWQEYQELLKLRESLDNIYDANVSGGMRNPHMNNKDNHLNPFSMSSNNMGQRQGQESSSFSQIQKELSESERLKLPLVGIYGNGNEAGSSGISSKNSFISGSDSDTINIVLEPIIENDQGTAIRSPQVMAIYPESDSDSMKKNISSLLGLDLDQLIEEVTATMGKVQSHHKVKEHHAQISSKQQQPTRYTFTETIADVYPGRDPKQPKVKIVSKQVQDGDLPLSIRSTIDRETLRNKYVGGVNLKKDSGYNINNQNASTSVNTKTNIINVFSFHIHLDKNKTNHFTVNAGLPSSTNIHTVASMTRSSSNSPQEQIHSMYNYEAEKTKPKKKGDLESWLKFLLENQSTDKKQHLSPSSIYDENHYPSDSSMSNSLVKRIGSSNSDSTIFFNDNRSQDKPSTSNLPNPLLAYLSQQSNSNYPTRRSDMYDFEDHDLASSKVDFTSMPYSNEMPQSFGSEYENIPSSFQQSLGFDSDPFATDALNRIVPLTDDVGSANLNGWSSDSFSNIGGLEYIDNDDSDRTTQRTPSKNDDDKGIGESLIDTISNNIPAIGLSALVTSPLWIGALGRRKRRRKRRQINDINRGGSKIPDDWMPYLLGNRNMNEDRNDELSIEAPRSLKINDKWSTPALKQRKRLRRPTEHHNWALYQIPNSGSASITRKKENYGQKLNQNEGKQLNKEDAYELLKAWQSMFKAADGKTTSNVVPTTPPYISDTLSKIVNRKKLANRKKTNSHKTKGSILKIDIKRPNQKRIPDDQISNDKTKSFSSPINENGSKRKTYPKQPPVLYHQEVIGNDVEVSISTATELNLVPTEEKKDPYAKKSPLKNNWGWSVGSRSSPTDGWLTAKDVLETIKAQSKTNDIPIKSHIEKLPHSPIKYKPISSIDPTRLPQSSEPFTFVKMNYKIPPKEKNGGTFAPMKKVTDGTIKNKKITAAPSQNFIQNYMKLIENSKRKQKPSVPKTKIQPIAEKKPPRIKDYVNDYNLKPGQIIRKATIEKLKLPPAIVVNSMPLKTTAKKANNEKNKHGFDNKFILKDKLITKNNVKYFNKYQSLREDNAKNKTISSQKSDLQKTRWNVIRQNNTNANSINKEQLNTKYTDPYSTTNKDNFNLNIINLQPDDDLKLALPVLLPNNVKPSKSYLNSLKNKFLPQISSQKKEPEQFVENSNSLLSFNDLLKKNYDHSQKDIFSTSKIEGTLGIKTKEGIKQSDEELSSNYGIPSLKYKPIKVNPSDSSFMEEGDESSSNSISKLPIKFQNSISPAFIEKVFRESNNKEEESHSSEENSSETVSNTESSATAIPINTTEILAWIKDLASSLGSSKNVSSLSGLEEAIILENEELPKPSKVVSSLPRPEAAGSNTDTRVVAVTTTKVTTTPRTDRYTQLTTTTARSIGSVINNVLSQSVVPLAGFSAATLAYGAAATLPVWLPLALGKKRRRRRKKRSKYNDKNFEYLSRYITSTRDVDL